MISARKCRIFVVFDGNIRRLLFSFFCVCVARCERQSQRASSLDCVTEKNILFYTLDWRERASEAEALAV